MIEKTIGQFIAETRKERNLTQRELGDILGVSDKTISHWERDESSPDITLIPELCKALGISTEEFFNREKKDDEPPNSSNFIKDKSENNMKDNKKGKCTDEQKYKRFLLLNIVSAGISIYGLSKSIFSLFQMNVFNLASFVGMPIVITIFIGALKYILISAILTVVVKIYYFEGLTPKDSTTNEKIFYKSNRVFFLNIYLLFFHIFSFLTSLLLKVLDFGFILYLMITIIVYLIVIIIVEMRLKKKGILKGKKYFKKI